MSSPHVTKLTKIPFIIHSVCIHGSPIVSKMLFHTREFFSRDPNRLHTMSPSVIPLPCLPLSSVSLLCFLGCLCSYFSFNSFFIPKAFSPPSYFTEVSQFSVICSCSLAISVLRTSISDLCWFSNQLVFMISSACSHFFMVWTVCSLHLFCLTVLSRARSFLLCPRVMEGRSVYRAWWPDWPSQLTKDMVAGCPAFQCCVCYSALALDSLFSCLSRFPTLFHLIAPPSTCVRKRICLSEWSVAGWFYCPSSPG